MGNIEYIPPSVIASWPAPNPHDPENRGYSFIIVSSIFLAISIAAVATRLWYRRRAKQLWWDDLLVVLALLCTAALSGIVGWASRTAWKLHMWDNFTSLTNIEDALKATFWAFILDPIGTALSRTSVLVFYYHLFGTTGSGRIWKYLVHSSIFVTLALGLSLCFITIFTCHPIYAYYTFPQPEGAMCMTNPQLIILAFGIMNSILNLLITALPVPVVIKLHMPLRERIGVIILLGLGSCTIVCAIVKTYYTWLALAGSYDHTWWCVPAWIAGIIEMNVILICSCAPSLRPLFAPHAKRVLNTIRGMTSRAPSSKTRSGPQQTTLSQWYHSDILSGTRSKQDGKAFEEPDLQKTVFVSYEVKQDFGGSEQNSHV